jgi:tryptophan synthase alpha chain
VKTLVIYLMSGRATPELAAAAVDGGADIVELGFPFSDPLADGPVIRRAAEQTDGWLYLVTLTGTTGAREGVSPGLARLVERARPLTTVPLYAGFGISTPEDARGAAELADGIIVGSRAVEVAENGPDTLREYVRSLRQAVDAVVPA